MTSSNAYARSKKYISLNKLGSKADSGNEICPVYVKLQKKKKRKKTTKNVGLNLVLVAFVFLKN